MEIITFDYFLKYLFGGIATLLSVGSVLLVYFLQEKNNKVKAARVLVMEIQNAEKVISEIKNSGVVSEASFLLPVESWKKYQHLFIKNLDSDELILINDFYNSCLLVQTEIDKMKSFLPISNEEKIKLTQHKLLELAEKYKSNPNNFDQLTDYIAERTSILDNIFYQESSWFEPSLSKTRVITYLGNTKYVMTSSCGQKLKKIAKIN